jgi:hypothetical protein
VEIGAPLGPLHRATELAREEAERDELRVRRDLVAEATADVLGDQPELVGTDPQRRRHHDRREAGELVVRRDRPLPGAPVVLDERAVQLERRRVEALEVQLGDLHDVIGLGERLVDVAPLPDAGVGHVSAGLLVEHGSPVLERLPCVDDDVERLEVDHHELGRVASELARLGDDRDDRLTDVAHLADRERVVLDASAGLGRNLEERVGEDRDLVARERPVDPRELERGADVDRDDPRMSVRRTEEMHIPHPVPLHVVEEGPLPLDEPAILLPRDALTDRALLERRRALCLDGCHAPPFPAATTASTMFQYPVQRQMLPCRATLTSSSVGLGVSSRSAAALISIPGVQ